MNDTGVEKPVAFGSLLRNSNLELISPQNHLEEDDIHVYEDRILIDLENAFWSSFTDTNSMDPLIDKGANGIEIRPESPDEIEPGDVISYESKFADGIIIHRVIEKGTDDNGVYFITKGDNNPIRDPEKVHFEQVKGILVGVIY
jgi:hypothetical protein